MPTNPTGAQRSNETYTSVTVSIQGLIGLMARAEVRRHLAHRTAANTATASIRKTGEDQPMIPAHTVGMEATQ